MRVAAPSSCSIECDAAALPLSEKKKDQRISSHCLRRQSKEPRAGFRVGWAFTGFVGWVADRSLDRRHLCTLSSSQLAFTLFPRFTRRAGLRPPVTQMILAPADPTRLRRLDSSPAAPTYLVLMLGTLV